MDVLSSSQSLEVLIIPLLMLLRPENASLTISIGRSFFESLLSASEIVGEEGRLLLLSMARA